MAIAERFAPEFGFAVGSKAGLESSLIQEPPAVIAMPSAKPESMRPVKMIGSLVSPIAIRTDPISATIGAGSMTTRRP